MSKTEPQYKVTKKGTLSIEEIEKVITSNVSKVTAFVFLNYKKLPLDSSTFFLLHKKICSDLFEEAGVPRKWEVTVWNLVVAKFYEIRIQLKELDDSITFRLPILKTEQDKKQFLAEIMYQFIKIHPFFDYNWRVVRLIGLLFLLKNDMNVTTFRWVNRTDFVNAMKIITSDNDYSLLINLL